MAKQPDGKNRLAPAIEVQRTIRDTSRFQQYSRKRGDPTTKDSSPVTLPLPKFGVALEEASAHSEPLVPVRDPITVEERFVNLPTVPEARRPVRLPKRVTPDAAAEECWYNFDYVSSNRPRPRAVIRPSASRLPTSPLRLPETPTAGPVDATSCSVHGEFSPTLTSPSKSPLTPKGSLLRPSTPVPEYLSETDFLNIETSPLSYVSGSLEGTPEAVKLRPNFAKLPPTKRQRIVCDLLTLF